MYTVIRFTASSQNVREISLIGEAMNKVRSGVYSGLRKAGDGFACDISKSDSWEDHDAAIRAFVAEFAPQIVQTRTIGGGVTVDVAIEPEDCRERVPVVRANPELLKILSSHHVTFEV